MGPSTKGNAVAQCVSIPVPHGKEWMHDKVKESFRATDELTFTQSCSVLYDGKGGEVVAFDSAALLQPYENGENRNTTRNHVRPQPAAAATACVAARKGGKAAGAIAVRNEFFWVAPRVKVLQRAARERRRIQIARDERPLLRRLRSSCSQRTGF
ncbi:hypothetical protein MRX96_057919 [Rhipicephalus microplus]